MSSSDRASIAVVRRTVASTSALARLLLVTLVAGCGFQLRGAPTFPPEMAATYIQAADRYTPFYEQLATVLRRNGITLMANPGAARTEVRILTDETGRRLLSVSARNVPNEYEVYYRLRFTVVVDGKEVVPVEQLTLTRDFAFDETRVLGKSGEEQILRQAIAEDLVGLVTRRLSTIH